MYLKRLYKYHKGWFLFVVLFAFGQLFINYKRGVVFSPFFNYGMYSIKFYPQQEYSVTAVYVNGKKLHSTAFTPQQWDNISVPVDLFSSQEENNHSVWQMNIKRMLHLQDSSKYLNVMDSAAFNHWYKSYLSYKFGFNENAIHVVKERYHFNGQFIPVQPYKNQWPNE